MELHFKCREAGPGEEISVCVVSMPLFRGVF